MSSSCAIMEHCGLLVGYGLKILVSIPILVNLRQVEVQQHSRGGN